MAEPGTCIAGVWSRQALSFRFTLNPEVVGFDFTLTVGPPFDRSNLYGDGRNSATARASLIPPEGARQVSRHSCVHEARVVLALSLHANGGDDWSRSCSASPVPEDRFRTGGLGRHIPEVCTTGAVSPSAWDQCPGSRANDFSDGCGR